MPCSCGMCPVCEPLFHVSIFGEHGPKLGHAHVWLCEHTPNGPRGSRQQAFPSCFQGCAGGGRREQPSVWRGWMQENLKRLSSLWSPRRSACEMICTLIKNDCILIEPFLLTSPPRERGRLGPEDGKPGKPNAGHSQQPTGAQAWGAEWRGVRGVRRC